MFKWVQITKGTLILGSQISMSLAKFVCKIKNDLEQKKIHDRQAGLR